jgi:hypothetical protein
MSLRIVPDPQWGPSECSSCGAAIIWAQTEAGRRMPVDAEAVPDGNLQLYTEELGGEPAEPGVQRVRFLTRNQVLVEQAAKRPLWRTHFATCPDGREWSGGGAAAVFEQLDLFRRRS